MLRFAFYFILCLDWTLNKMYEYLRFTMQDMNRRFGKLIHHIGMYDVWGGNLLNEFNFFRIRFSFFHRPCSPLIIQIPLLFAPFDKEFTKNDRTSRGVSVYVEIVNFVVAFEIIRFEDKRKNALLYCLSYAIQMEWIHFSKCLLKTFSIQDKSRISGTSNIECRIEMVQSPMRKLIHSIRIEYYRLLINYYYYYFNGENRMKERPLTFDLFFENQTLFPFVYSIWFYYMRLNARLLHIKYVRGRIQATKYWIIHWHRKHTSIWFLIRIAHVRYNEWAI